MPGSVGRSNSRRKTVYDRLPVLLIEIVNKVIQFRIQPQITQSILNLLYQFIPPVSHGSAIWHGEKRVEINFTVANSGQLRFNTCVYSHGTIKADCSTKHNQNRASQKNRRYLELGKSRAAKH